MGTEDRFKTIVIATLAKRAASRCSNPDCGAITSGPSDDRSSSVNVGEAAHIYGAHPGSARYDASMESADRADITNAIWLCGNCHKLVDDDPAKYPAGLLFEWQKDHEHQIAEQVGKAGAELRRRYETRHLEEFGKLSYLAERIITEKGSLWEYKLTAEVLRCELAPIMRRWASLRRGLYVKTSKRLPTAETVHWLASRFNETLKITNALTELLNVEIARSWGESGTPGDDVLIVETCRLFAEVCRSALKWEERVTFTKVDDIFESSRKLMEGTIGQIIEEAAKVADFLAGVLTMADPTGEHRLSLVFKLPQGWEEAFSSACGEAEAAMRERRLSI